MPQLDEQSVEFARRHITRFYDTDFFPKHFALEAIWHNWEEAKRTLVGRPPNELPLSTPRILAWPKVQGGYRIVHQLDPLSSVAYAAIVHQVAAAIENGRVPARQNVACSYRINLADGSFFDTGTGYSGFRAQSERLGKTFSHVLVTDITDFYNQIYVHRIRNAISTVDSRLEDIGADVEQLLLRWNSRTSQGIPVGPAPSIVLSEALLIDVDRFIAGKGLIHTRYVDDFRIFANSEAQLKELLRDLTAYLYESHRLNLAGTKTKISTTAEFLAVSLGNPYEIEKIEIFEAIQEVLNPYTQELEVVEQEGGREEAIKALTELLDRVLGRHHLDLGLARAVLRRARGLKIRELVPRVLDAAHELLVVVNDVFLYLDAVETPTPSNVCLDSLTRAIQTQIGTEPAFRIWAEWFLTRSPDFTRQRTALRDYVRGARHLLPHARLAVIETDVAWVRSQRNQFWELASNDRLAVLFATPILARDEREPWLRGILRPESGATTMERWMARTALDNAFDFAFAELDADIPF